MDPLSERARALLGRYREADVLPEAGRERILQGVADRVARGEAPPTEVDMAPPQPVAGLGAGAKVVIGLAVGIVAVPIVAGLVGRGDDGIERVRAPMPVVAAVPDAVEPPVPEPAEPVAENPEPDVREPAPQPKRARREQPPKPAPEVPTIDAEMKLLKAAKAALRAGDADRALAGLAQHQREFPDGKLADLREVVRIEALCRLDRNDEAEAASREFLRKRPGSPHSHRVRDACERISP
jgi:hypothetical protein